MKNDRNRRDTDISLEHKKACKIYKDGYHYDSYGIGKESKHKTKKNEEEPKLIESIKNLKEGLQMLQLKPKKKTNIPFKFLMYPETFCFTFVINLLAFLVFSIGIFGQSYSQHYFAA